MLHDPSMSDLHFPKWEQVQGFNGVSVSHISAQLVS